MGEIKYLLKDAKSLFSQELLIGYEVFVSSEKYEGKYQYLLYFQNSLGALGVLVDARTEKYRIFNSLDVLFNVVCSVGFLPVFISSRQLSRPYDADFKS